MTSIFVAKLDFGVTEDELRQLFAEYGRVNKASIAVDKETRKPRGFAFVEMADADEAAQAIKGLDGRTINGRQIAVKAAEARPDNRNSDNRGGGDRRNDRNDGNRRPDFNRNNNSPRTNVQSEYKKPIEDRPRGIVVNNPEEIKVEVKKKEKDKKEGGKDWIS